MCSIFQVKNAMEYGVKGMLLYGDPIDFAKEGTVYSNRCEIFGLFLLSFPQNERRIYYFCSVSFAQFVHILKEVCLLFNF